MPTVPGSPTFNYLAILTATVSTFVLGGAWYSPVLFGRIWMQEMGFTEESLKARADVGRIMGLSFLLELVMAFNLAVLIGGGATPGFGLVAGAMAGFGGVALALGVTYLFERKSLRLYLINAGYHALAFTLMGAILGAWH